MKFKKLRLILGDQLNADHPWFTKREEDTLYVMMEVLPETNYTKHHIQKLCMFFAAMRAFAANKQKEGHHFCYFQITDPQNRQSFVANVEYLVNKHSIQNIEYQMPDEFRLDELLKKDFKSIPNLTVSVTDTHHFLTQREELKDFFRGKKMWLMESFYRYMRKKHNILMEGFDPEGGKWNFDSSNRKKLPEKHIPVSPYLFSNDLSNIKNEIDSLKITYFGNIDESNVIWPINREQAKALLQFFTNNCLPLFGHYQDAMAKKQWSIYHARLSFAMNVKMLHPLEVINTAIETYRNSNGNIDIAQIEGFVRQIIGWREYMRGIYWAHMPEYAQKNYFSYSRKLPQMYWTGKTKMNCMKDAIGQSLDYAYAHHIQRLMVTGNFALLMETHPDEVDAWYLGVYIDAIEWVEITNTRGMSQFADGGIVGTKPYVSSAAYIDKMSNYCNNCFYDKKDKTSANACPFNTLYWNFIDRNQEKFLRNPRMAMMVRTWQKMKSENKADILNKAADLLEKRDYL